MCKVSYDPSRVNQDHLYKVIQKLFPNEKSIFSNVRKGAHIKSPYSHYSLEIDVWLPRINLCFEFQDIYHYTSTWYSHSPLSVVQASDDIKKQELCNRGDTLISVPCWWDGSRQSLWDTVAFVRPDLRPLWKTYEHPILLNPHDYFFKETEVPDVGDLMLASFPPADVRISRLISPCNPWWVGEKYDGVRSCWHPDHKKMYNRRGGEIETSIAKPLANFTSKIFVDGELWCGRGTFINSLSFMESNGFLSFVAFDCASPTVQHMAFEHRYELLLCALSKELTPMVVVAARLLVHTPRALEHRGDGVLALVTRAGGEGIILRRPGSSYEHGRSIHLLKLKENYEDQEALVVRVGSSYEPYILQLPTGDTFELSHKNVRTNPLPGQGAIVSFKYETPSQKVLLKNAIVFQVREDLTWQDVIHSYAQQATFSLEQVRANELVHNLHHKSKIRTFFERIARGRNLDPGQPKTWYFLYKDALFLKQTETIVRRIYNGDTIAAMLDLLPNIGLNKRWFAESTQDSVGNRRNFLIKFAKHKAGKSDAAFDRQFWYSLHPGELRHYKGVFSILNHYNGDLGAALLHLFPEIHWSSGRFADQSFWLNSKNKTEFFATFAKQQQFDPLIASNWHNVKWETMKVFQKFPLFNKQNFIKTLLQVYPNIGLSPLKFSFLPKENWFRDNEAIKFEQLAIEQGSIDPIHDKNFRSLFTSHKGEIAKTHSNTLPIEKVRFRANARKPKTYPQKYWQDNVNRRNFFIKYAAENHFNPLVAENWYSCTSKHIRTFKGGLSVLFYYNKSLITALLHLFPDIGLDKSKFISKQKSFWKDIDNQRDFCVKFAEKSSFDPLIAENWYSVPVDDFIAAGGLRVLANNSFSFKQLLQKVFSVTIDASLRKKHPRNHWLDKQNRRDFFIRFANQHEFDPLLPKNWYKLLYQSKSLLTTAKGAQGLLKYYQHNCWDALLDVFPDIGLEAHKIA